MSDLSMLQEYLRAIEAQVGTLVNLDETNVAIQAYSSDFPLSMAVADVLDYRNLVVMTGQYEMSSNGQKTWTAVHKATGTKMVLSFEPEGLVLKGWTAIVPHSEDDITVMLINCCKAV